MKLFQRLLLAPAALGLLAPISANANEVNLKEISNYSDLENFEVSNSFNNDELIENTLLAGGEGLVDDDSHDGGFSSTTSASFSVDFAKHAESMGAYGRKVETLNELDQAMKWAQKNDKTTVITIPTDAFEWTPGDASWDVGVPQVSSRTEVTNARNDHNKIRSKQRIGV